MIPKAILTTFLAATSAFAAKRKNPYVVMVFGVFGFVPASLIMLTSDRHNHSIAYNAIFMDARMMVVKGFVPNIMFQSAHNSSKTLFFRLHSC